MDDLNFWAQEHIVPQKITFLQPLFNIVQPWPVITFEAHKESNIT